MSVDVVTSIGFQRGQKSEGRYKLVSVTKNDCFGHPSERGSEVLSGGKTGKSIKEKKGQMIRNYCRFLFDAVHLYRNFFFAT